jgi:low affinity Fe/Cu permease
MRMIGSAINAFAAFLARPAGYLAIMATLFAGGALLVLFGLSNGAQLAFNLYLSILAIVIGCAILVAGDRDTKAIHAKLDELILLSNARNEAIGLEHREVEEIEAEIRKAEAEGG